MSLRTYQQKRNFKLTSEPRGTRRRASADTLQFVIQKHDATRLHYDFRLELDGTLKSWAVPKGPSLDPSRKALAVQVEDHPIEYGDFEGIIPEGQYGGGTVLLWDRGAWKPLSDPAEGFERGKLHFILHGEKLHGEWSLVRMHGPAGDHGKNWLLMKVNDKYASKTRDITVEKPNSVKTKRTLEKIARAGDRVWNSQPRSERRSAQNSTKQGSTLPPVFSPQLPVLAERPPHGEQWIHEIKFDGYRLLAFIEDGNVRLMTRNGLDWTDKFPKIAQALGKLKVDNAVVDGEAVALDQDGRSNFEALQMSFKNGTGAQPVLFAFDLPFCDGVDLHEEPLLKRKEQLQEILKRSRLEPIINFSDHVRGSGERVIAKACGMALEGIVSKKFDAPYLSRRDPSWVKSKCGNRQEFIIIGFTDPQGSRSGFGSLLLGYHDDQDRLIYGGRVGTGFDEKQLVRLRQQFEKIEQKDPPTDVAPPRREQRHAHWLKPLLVGEVRFTGWTRDGVLRHPAFIALRSDKPAAQIVREKPVKPQKLRSLSQGARNGHSHPASNGKSSDSAIAGVTLTHPDKRLYAPAAVTKRDIAEYYVAAAQWMLPHVVDRPLALRRCPDGVAGQCFVQRNWYATMPKTVGKVDVGSGSKREEHVTVHDLAGVIGLVQFGALEVHTWNCHSNDIEHPDQLIFDLDPGPGVTWGKIVEGAHTLHSVLESLKLPAFLKTSGGKGLHLTIPIVRNIDWDAAKSFTKAIALSLVQNSDLFVANMRKDLRGGKIYLDYNRNGRSATAIAPYSTRARPGAAVSMPISWNELGKVKSANQYKLPEVVRYLAKRKSDPWADFEKSRIDVRKLVQEKSAK